MWAVIIPMVAFLCLFVQETLQVVIHQPGDIIPVFFGNEIKPAFPIEAYRIAVSVHRYETASGTVPVGEHIFDKTDNIPADTLSGIFFRHCQSSYFYRRIVFPSFGVRNASA